MVTKFGKGVEKENKATSRNRARILLVHVSRLTATRRGVSLVDHAVLPLHHHG